MNRMDGSAHTSIYVAPLQINKDRSRAASRSSDRPTTSSGASCSTGIQGHNGQMTPPLTPLEAETRLDRRHDFQTYVRAFYPYHPSCEEGSSTVTLPLNSGDVILVHSVHTNGWADGTLLVSGARGWLPTNYCEGYDNEPIRSLLKALTVFWDLVKGSSNGDASVFRSSDYVRGLIAGVRCLLETTHCLTRESQLVHSHNEIRKYRKVLLSELSSFVKETKTLENKLNCARTTERFALELDPLVIKAFKTVIRAVKFLDVWEEVMRSIAPATNHTDAPPTPPADRSSFASTGKVDEHDSVPTGQSAAENLDNSPGDSPEQSNRPHYNRASKTYIRPGSSNSGRLSRLPSSRQERDYVSHRVSCVAYPGSQNLASEKLSTFHNAFLTTLGYFIGLHLHSRPSSEALLTTKEAVLACRDMLDLAGEIWERDHRSSRVLEEARDNMYRRIADLADAARLVFRPLRSEEDDILLPGEGRPLVEAATACVRAAGICITESRFVVDRIGDFDFPPLGLGITEFDGTSTPYTLSETLQPSPEEEKKIKKRSIVPAPPANSPEVQQTPTIASIVLTESAPQESPLQPGSTTLKRISSDMLLPPLPTFTTPTLTQDDYCPSPQLSINSVTESHSDESTRSRNNSIGVSSAGDSTAYLGSVRDSDNSAISQPSTRATSPDATYLTAANRNKSVATSLSSCHVENEEIEDSILERTYAHELVFNKDGQITGGTLPALIERLTTPESTPDSTFVSTFYLTFRLFATPLDFAQALIDRYNYVGDSPRISGPVRLRVYNVFKGWMESHWRKDCDNCALELIISFAARQLQIVLPTAGKRLANLAVKVSAVEGPLVPRLISSIGKTNTSIASYIPPDTPLPPTSISRSQLNALKNWKHGGATIGILDVDPLEFSRQLTLKESQIFCSILPEELLACEWTKQTCSMAINVRAMSRLSTDLANLVADDILKEDDTKKRAAIIKQWVKIASRLLELSNYHSLMAIVCSLTQSAIMRLKRTWEHVATKTKLSLEKLKCFINHDRNHARLRNVFQNQIPPCVPWVGLYLTDLTFVDAGNQTTRQLPGVGLEESKSVINFDKHTKTAKIISELQRFQVPYRLQEVAELQTWLQDQLVRVRTVDQTEVVKNYYRRSLLLEPRTAETHPAASKLEMLFLGKSGPSIPSIIHGVL